MTEHHDPNDRTSPRPCRACGALFVPPLRGPVAETCSGSRVDGAKVPKRDRDRCRKRAERQDASGFEGRLLAKFYGTGDPLGHTLPGPGSLAALADEYGISWSDEFECYREERDDGEERAIASGLRPLVEERPLGIDPRSHKRRTGVEDAPEDGGALLPADLRAQTGDRFGFPYRVGNLADDHPEDVL